MRSRLATSFFALSFLGTAAAQAPPAATKHAGQVTAFVEVLSAHFGEWDTDRDGVLQVGELDTAVARVTTTGDKAAAVAAVKRSSRSKSLASLPLTLKNLKNLASEAPSKDKPDLGAMFADGQRRIAAADKRLFAQGPPSLDRLQQGKIGDCFCLAPLGAMLHRDPAQVESMFKPQPDGSCKVTFGREVFHVAPTTDAEIAMSSSSEASGTWSNVYEKASGMARNAQKPEKTRVALAVDAVARGGSAGTHLALITGHQIVRFSCKFARDKKVPASEFEQQLIELRKLLTRALKEKRLITTGTNSPGPSGPTIRGIRSGHAYAVLGYDAGSDEIRLWDPHGDSFTPAGAPGTEHGYPRADGLFSMPLPIFVKQYAGLAFEQLTPDVGPITAE